MARGTPAVSDVYLYCDVCAARAMTFARGGPAGEDCLYVRGLVTEIEMPVEHVAHVYRLLGARAVRTLHEYVSRWSRKTGLEAYCPECGRTYCHKHMKTYPVREQSGAYHHTLGVCPHGHVRTIAQ